MTLRLIWISVLSLLFATSPKLQAQNTIFTQTLGVTSICPGSTLDVPFTRTGTYNTSNVFTVQLSDGGDYNNIATGSVSYNSSTEVYTVSATIPANQAAGTTYTLRVTASSPAVIGTPSASRLTIKTKPTLPTVDAEIVQCQRPVGSLRRYTLIPVKISATTGTPKLYNANGISPSYAVINYGPAITDKAFEVYGTNEIASEIDYNVTQEIDGCESNKAFVKVTTKPIPSSEITVDNFVGYGDGAVYGKVAYCQNDVGLPLDQKGHKPVSNGIFISYKKESGDVEYNGSPPTPKTDKVGTIQFSMIHSLNGCPASLRPTAYITVTVNAQPTKPAISSNTISLCQFGQSSPLTATVTDGNASLVWYGTNATGGTGSTAATQPSTAIVGTFKYYVAQQLNDCEGERAEIIVEVKAAAPAPTVSAVSYCQGTQAVQLTAVAASGGTLSWYTSASGGTSVPFGPTPSTNVVGIQTYYVAQTVGTSCESQRVPLVVTINGAPAAPTLPRPTYTFCQNAQGETLTATGQNLRWYETTTGSTSVGSSVMPNTSVAGTKNYYVSQTINGCEGPRNTITVSVLEAPAAPTVSKTDYEFCQGTLNATISGTVNPNASTGWYIYGDEPGLINFYTSSSTAYAVVSTAQARTLTYSLFQTGSNGCKGPASQQINITVKPTPSTPVVQSVAVCQNATTPVIQAAGQNLLWYGSASGGTGSATTPVVSTSQTSQTTYYVSQSLNGCESQRAALSVTVNAIPGVPLVAATSPVYCQNAPATALTAEGQGLKWYRESSGGTSLGDKPVPETKEAGSFTYYVSQSVNGCEGSRSSLTVKVNGLPASPSVLKNPNSFCRFDSKPVIVIGSKANYILQTRYVLYVPDGILRDTLSLQTLDKDTVSLTSALVLTDEIGNLTYTILNRDNNGCSSRPVSFSITIKPTPGAPVTAALSVCQNTTGQVVSASGQDLRWYTAEAAGTGTPTAPTLNTGQAGVTNYYVSQTVDGCEGPRATLAAMVKALPTAPGVMQKSICQFAPAEAASATGEGLTWYNADGNKFGSTPVINTEKGTTFTFQVTQTVNGCEGPKASLSVNVLTTPLPTVSKSTVELCQGTTPQPLQATGTNLRWTDPNGVVSANVPVPPTLNATTNPDGDVYYVTQTGTNNCESAKVAIRVFVQTAPTMAILGTTTVNLGLEVPLKLTFTGVGPYMYKLSNGLTGRANKDTTLLVLPERTTVYQVVEVTNKCGAGLPGNGASATVTVLVPTIQTLAFANTTVCAGASLPISYLTSGQFNSGSIFKLQVAKAEADTAKINFVEVSASQLTDGQIVGTLPTNLPAGQYWVRVMATNPKIPINGTKSTTLLTIRPLATATLMGNQNIYEGQPARLSVTFTGDGPWVFTYRDSTAIGPGTTHTVTATANPYLLEVRPTKTTTYLLTSVNNGCGNGAKVSGSALVNVAPLLGIEDQSLTDAVDVYPIPATTTLTVRIRGLTSAQSARLKLTNLIGHPVIQHETRRETSVLSLDQQPAGVYVLHIQVGDRTASKRIVKL